jgi:hypothetical protein
LPLFGYFLGFFGECTDDADVTVMNNDFLLSCPGVPLCPFADLNFLDKQVQEITA